MDASNWRPPTPGSEGLTEGDWRTQLLPESRSRIVNKIMEILKRRLPFSGPEGMNELKKIASPFEEKIYTSATSQLDYLRKISVKMVTMEAKSHANGMPSNSGGNGSWPPDAAWRPPTPGSEGLPYGDWRTQLLPESRSRIVNKIMEILKRRLPFSGPERMNELKKIASRFEEKIYTSATSQLDYLRKISVMMVTMEAKSHANGMPTNSGGNGSRPPDAGTSLN